MNVSDITALASGSLVFDQKVIFKVTRSSCNVHSVYFFWEGYLLNGCHISSLKCRRFQVTFCG